jgi:hypothetical protein
MIISRFLPRLNRRPTLQQGQCFIQLYFPDKFLFVFSETSFFLNVFFRKNRTRSYFFGYHGVRLVVHAGWYAYCELEENPTLAKRYLAGYKILFFKKKWYVRNEPADFSVVAPQIFLFFIKKNGTIQNKKKANTCFFVFLTTI